MPTNLPPEALDKWAEVEAAHGQKQKLQKMQEFLACVPQHKGTMKLRGQIKKKMAIIRDDLEDKKRKGTGKGGGGPKLFIEKEGTAQIALLGDTNVGKSCLMAALTNANVTVSPTPYCTREPVPGIMSYMDVQFQMVEAPALMHGSADGRAWGLQTLGLARNADGLILMVDLSRNPVEQMELVLGELEKTRVLVAKPKGKVDIDRRYAGAALRIMLFGKLVGTSMREVEDLLRSYKVNDAIVRISGEVTLEDVEDAIFESTIYKPTLIVANKLDVKGAERNLRVLKRYVDGKMPVIPVSCERRIGLDDVGKAIVEALGVIRIYTKEPGMRVDSDHPFALRRGATVGELARNIHKELVANFLFAMVWAKRLPFSPKKVGVSFILEDGDVVEIHTRIDHSSSQ